MAAIVRISGPSLAAVRSPKSTRSLVRALWAALAIVVLALTWVPWQQTAVGAGRVVAYAPVDRLQSIETPIEGRIDRWHVREGSRVKEGDRIADIVDNDPEILSRLRAERDAHVARLEAARSRVAAVEERQRALEGSRRSGIVAAGSRVRMARERTRGAEQSLKAAEAAERTAQLNLDRQRALGKDGLAATRAVEVAELDHLRALTDLERAQAAVSGARAEEMALGSDRERIETDASASINDVEAQRSVALAEIAAATTEIVRVDTRLARQSAQHVSAPRDGIVVRVSGGQGGEFVKSGDRIAEIVPDTSDRAIELWMDGNDVPLVQEGRRVRVQIEGWPAIQFSGWPSVAVGTFGGTVALIDATDDGQGRFRVVVVPDASEPWPAQLRQGMRAQGWVILDRVRLGFEIWRRLNGFPASVAAPPKGDAAKPTTKGESK